MKLEDKAFGVLVIAVSIGFIWVTLPLFGAILWAVVAAILFEPLYRRLTVSMPKRQNVAAILTVLAVIALVVVPAMFLGALLIQEAAGLYARLQSGQIDFAHYFEVARGFLPSWANNLLERVGLADFQAAQAKLSQGIANSLQMLMAKALNIGQGALGFIMALGVMLYLLFFLLRDADGLTALIERRVPLRDEQRRALVAKFVAVVRATIRGSLLVAILQGLIGGLLFWILGIQGPVLWGVAMAFLSLLPAIGTGLVWAPVAICLLLTGSLWQGAVLIFCGVFVIGLVDNVLRPILVGRNTQMPDYVVLISTLGGIEVFGFSGFVIGPVIAALFISVWEIYTEPALRPGKASA